ncbi:hemerythrin domain-containing protein [Pelagibius sp. 7325]|uniref:hemerythrin domain-containing protein n=1 Tax=Pelagibius sp. 7325 TaxID=3131994 RepID=UPI0030EC224D
MNIYDRIKQDHDEARGLMAEIKDTTERAAKTRRQLFDTFKREMWAHHKIEEAVFYNTLMKQRDTRDEAFEAVNEHHVANGLLEELDSVPVDSAQWASKFGVLCELMEHHMEEEEGETFTEAREVLSEEAAQSMGKSFESRKKAVLAAMEPLELAS